VVDSLRGREKCLLCHRIAKGEGGGEGLCLVVEEKREKRKKGSPGDPLLRGGP